MKYVLCFVLFLTGCTTTAVPTSKATEVPIDGIYNEQTPDSGLVIIKRDEGFMASRCTTHIYVNTEQVADVEEAEKVLLHLPKGDYTISVVSGDGLCPERESAQSIRVTEGSRMVYRITFTSGGDLVFNPTVF